MATRLQGLQRSQLALGRALARRLGNAVGRAARVPARGWPERLLAVAWVAGAGILALLAFRVGYDLLVDPELRAGARADFDRRLKGRTYVSPLPPERKPPRYLLERHQPLQPKLLDG